MAKEKESYKDRLEARAQRGDMTHQKEFALNVRQQKEEQDKQDDKPKSRTTKKQEGSNQ
ncbi:hypothetical protein [Enterococcus plantarum]|uniref:hypothetical protein n=1 Tax=Enterococcus TaxID=1350 RepID=UPI0015E8BA6B|nr:hypothetical protein [Enterococcus plantarum]